MEGRKEGGEPGGWCPFQGGTNLDGLDQDLGKIQSDPLGVLCVMPVSLGFSPVRLPQGREGGPQKIQRARKREDGRKGRRKDDGRRGTRMYAARKSHQSARHTANFLGAVSPENWEGDGTRTKSNLITINLLHQFTSLQKNIVHKGDSSLLSMTNDTRSQQGKRGEGREW